MYKWRHFRSVLTTVLVQQYTQLTATGWQVSQAELDRDIQDLFGGAFTRFAGG